MAKRAESKEGDAISRLADAGEDALRRLVGLPRRTVVGAIDRVGERLREAGDRLRAIDPLYGRVVAMEKRLDSLEKPPKRSTRRASTRTKSATARRARPTVARDREAGESDVGRQETARPSAEPEPGVVQVADERKPPRSPAPGD